MASASPRPRGAGNAKRLTTWYRRRMLRIVRVHGAQAEGAAQLGLMKITEKTAEALWELGFPVILVGNGVGVHAFFGGWNLAFPMRPKSDDGNFSVQANAFVANLDTELGSGPAFFIRPTLTEEELRKVGLASYLLYEKALAEAMMPASLRRASRRRLDR